MLLTWLSPGISALSMLSNTDSYQISILTLEGKSVSKFELGTMYPGIHNRAVNITNLKPGMYLVTCKADDATIYRKLVIR